MTKHRATIAVCLSGYDNEYEIKAVVSAWHRCRELGLNMLVYFSTLKKTELDRDEEIPAAVLKGEMQIYEQINYEAIDGIILFGASIPYEPTFDTIIRRAAAHRIPLIDVDDLIHDNCRRVILNNDLGMEKITDHLIEVHGCRNMYFISGFPQNPESEQREAAFARSLERHGLPFDQSKVYYGNFFRKAYQCTEEILERDYPDAILCANDTMAFYCMDCLKERGLHIPEDIIVTGFDSISDSSEYSPIPTTVRRAMPEAGEAAVDALYQAIQNGEEIKEDVFVSSVLVKGQSCGCIGNDEKIVLYESRNDRFYDFKSFNRCIVVMNRLFSRAQNADELCDALYAGAKEFHIDKMYVCLRSEIVDNGISEQNCPLPRRMRSMFRQGHDVPVGTEFDAAELIPGGLQDEAEPVLFCMIPLYHNDADLGYLACVPTQLQIEAEMLSAWVQTIENRVGGFFVNQKLSAALEELQSLYCSDPLTGVLNRRGLDTKTTDWIAETLAQGTGFAVFCADVDGLKKINVSFGHEAGDDAIVMCCEALRQSLPKDSLIARTGGDEFVMMARFAEEAEIERCIRRINTFTEHYNATSGKPYQIGCSCGYSFAAPNSTYSIDSMKRTADENMYAEKIRRKAVRI